MGKGQLMAHDISSSTISSNKFWDVTSHKQCNDILFNPAFRATWRLSKTRSLFHERVSYQINMKQFLKQWNIMISVLMAGSIPKAMCNSCSTDAITLSNQQSQFAWLLQGFRVLQRPFKPLMAFGSIEKCVSTHRTKWTEVKHWFCVSICPI